MNCEQFRERIGDYLDGALDEAGRREMEEHDRMCPECHAFLDDIKKITGALNALPDSMPVPLAAQAGWRKAIREEKRRKAGFFSRGLATVAAALLVLFGATFISRQNPARTALTANPAVPEAGAYLEETAGEYDGYGVVDSAPRFFGAQMTDGTLKREIVGVSDEAAPAASLGASAEESAAKEPEAEKPAAQVRVVRSAQVVMDTAEYEKDCMMLQNIVLGCEGYYEVSSETSQKGQALQALIRVPVSRLDDFMAEIEMVGTIREKTLRAEDVSDRFADLASRLSACEEKLEKLYELRDGCTDVNDLVTITDGIEEALSEQERLLGRQNALAVQEEYARIRVTLREEGAEYEPLAEDETIAPASGDASRSTVGSRIGEEFSGSVSWVKSFFGDAAVLLVGNLPKLVIAVPAIVLLVLLIAAIRRRKRK